MPITTTKSAYAQGIWPRGGGVLCLVRERTRGTQAAHRADGQLLPERLGRVGRKHQAHGLGDPPLARLPDRARRAALQPCHHQTREYLRAYVQAAGFEPRARVPLFQSAPGRKPVLSGKAIASGKVWDAVKRRCKAAAARNVKRHIDRVPVIRRLIAAEANVDEVGPRPVDLPAIEALLVAGTATK